MSKPSWASSSTPPSRRSRRRWHGSPRCRHRSAPSTSPPSRTSTRTQLIIDGTLLPCWSWHDHPEDYSGKHLTTGFNVQVACTLSGALAWVSDPLPGRTHDVKALRESGLLDTPDDVTVQHLGDKGYIGLGMITPMRKPTFRGLLEWEKDFNRQVNQVRYQIERTIANLKTWRILHTDYRRPHKTFSSTISTVIALEFYRQAF